MTLKTFIVEPISKAQITSFTERKHYSKSVGVVTKAFALVHNNIIEGIITYRPPSRPIEQYAFKDRDFPIYELARLVVQTSVPNAASYFISKTLGLLEPHCAIVSYADTEWSHVGIVYQATNWIYTGKTKANDNSYMINGKKVHPRTLGIRDNSLSKWAKEMGYEAVHPSFKHRYFFFKGTHKQKKRMMESFRYEIITPYPKIDKQTYDNGPRIEKPFEEIRTFI